MATSSTLGAEARAHRSAVARARLSGLWVDVTAGAPLDGVALALVGSHARGEAGPHSDLDLVLLHDGASRRPRPGGAHREIAELADALWYPMWDQSIRFDHSVRTVSECRSVAGTDLTAALGLLDLSFVAGDPSVVEAARAAVGHDWRKLARGRLGELVEAVTARHTRSGDAAQLLAPDLKESRGGLRDMTVLRALTAAWLADRPHGDVDAAYLELLDVRDALHEVTGRARERLDREVLAEVAHHLGHDAPDDALQQVSTAARTIAFALDGTLRRASQAAAARRLRIGPRRPQLRHLGHGLYEHEGELVLGAGVDDTRSPLHLSLRAAATAAAAGLPLSRATLSHLASALAATPPDWDASARDLLSRVLASGDTLVPLWEGLDLAGVVSSWLPEWDLVRCRPQHNPVHRHTVDRHSIEAVAAAGRHLREVARPDLLLVAALLHDLGKAEGTVDHPAAGVAIAARVLGRWGMPSADTRIVLTLVAQHLTLANLATRRDPDDPATVTALAEAAERDVDTLDLLRALTLADARATGGAAWTPWRVRLIDTLVSATRDALRAPVRRGGEERRVQSSDAAARVESARPLPVGAGPEAASVWVAGGSIGEPGVHVVRVTAPDRLGLFADVAGLLAVGGHAVLSARLRTQGPVAVQEWHVDGDGGMAPDPRDLERKIARLCGGDDHPLRQLSRHTGPSALTHWSGRQPGSGVAADATVRVIPEASATATVLEVRAGDRRGLLHDVGRALADVGVSIRSAHVETFAGQANDVFYLTDPSGRYLSAGRAQAAVRAVAAALGN